MNVSRPLCRLDLLQRPIWRWQFFPFSALHQIWISICARFLPLVPYSSNAYWIEWVSFHQNSPVKNIVWNQIVSLHLLNKNLTHFEFEHVEIGGIIIIGFSKREIYDFMGIIRNSGIQHCNSKIKTIEIGGNETISIHIVELLYLFFYLKILIRLKWSVGSLDDSCQIFSYMKK